MKAIVAVDKNWGIGCNGNLLAYIPDDLKYFKRMTKNNVVVMGRKTLESLPGSKPLSLRENIVITRDINYSIENCIIFNDILTAVEEIVKIKDKDVFIIGGESIYKQFLPFVTECYVTKIDKEFDADTYFPNLEDLDWKLVEKSEKQFYNNIGYTWCKYVRIK